MEETTAAAPSNRSRNGLLTAQDKKPKPVATTTNQLGEAVDDLQASINYLEGEAVAVLRGSDDSQKAVADTGAYPGMSQHHSQLDNILASVRRATQQIRDITDRLEV